ncbi:periplasmic heavy metal sensor [Rubellimicrobium roseum]|uniref:periplasmic heavy metal sensor n=1 Tax=Rubellimicrobium roseum TaxID=687525 RepID=UPI00159BB2CF|nr:periplasmic heavy metal sensor [Rubellimicrobium roseum]
MTDTAASPRPGLSRPLRWLLVVSLGLNLLVAGLAVGALLHGDGPHGRPRPVELALGPMSRALEEEDRRAVLEALDRSGVLARHGRRAREAEMAGMLAAIRREPFDPVALAEAMDRLRAGRAEIEAAVQAAVMERIAGMEPVQRAAFADRIEQGRGRGGRN